MKKTSATLAVLVLAVAGCGADSGDRPETSAPAKVRSWQLEHVDKTVRGEMTTVTAASEDDIWAAGWESDNGDMSDPRGQFLMRYEGGGWQRRKPPAELDGNIFHPRLDSSGPDNVWIFGSGADFAVGVARWDGDRWQRVPRPPGSGTVSETKVFAPDDVWVLLGERQAQHWDGRRWTTHALPAAANALDGTAGDDLWAVGFRTSGPGVDGAGGELSQPAAMHWDGTSWTSTPTPSYRFPEPVPPEPGASLDGVEVVSPKEAWAFGSHTFNHGEVEEEPPIEHILLRWDGSRWHERKVARGDDCLSRNIVTHGEDGGLLFGVRRYRSPEGRCTKLSWPHLPAEGEVTAKGRQQLWLDPVVPVPGTRKFIGVGKVYVMQSGNPLTMPTIATYEPPRSP
ncbi:MULTISPECIES: hypothetical protein [Streptomyces]|uniref:Secreted protein n=1 Tax=Streptomyces venezuelae TaxID=54571 RepID=A0A5P2BKU5_STRVZ|nr:MULTISPECIES: hypothetical protein [Streptomyces]NDZ98038.1 hypothetical protein [Streptomyces sp. SID10116]MYY85505.1 hypothetical protein [Streptomyces sp. SID335]MYZ15432.1 hypothetical protein [Streptomyces sp. SID337]NDZ86294.1 hypothetical protein [Streptomyces sp. SID10115]NEB43721.1 hypothetical protein [Streptomyces sp. SID339]